jgi:hypothetical protein
VRGCADSIGLFFLYMTLCIHFLFAIKLPKCLFCQKPQIIFSECPASQTFEFHVQSLSHPEPGNSFGYLERHPTWFSKCIVPCNRGPRVWFLIPMHDNHNGQRKCPDLLYFSLAKEKKTLQRESHITLKINSFSPTVN